MKEVLLVRHGESYANKRDFAAFGNVDSPLTKRGVIQAESLNGVFKSEFGILPEEYGKPVAASEFTRSQQTAECAGFKKMHILPLINESDVDREIASGNDVIDKHHKECWVPEEVAQRASQFIDRVNEGHLGYEVYFTHGMFIAAVLLECETRLIEVEADFDAKRGYVPLQATITQLIL